MMETPALVSWLQELLFRDIPSFLSQNHLFVWGFIVLAILVWSFGPGFYYALLERRERTAPLTAQEEKQLRELEESRRVARLKQQEEHREKVRLAEERRRAKEEEKRLQKLQELEASLRVSPSDSTRGQRLGDGTEKPSRSESSRHYKSSSLRPEYNPLGGSGGGGGYRPSGFQRPSRGG